MGPQLIATGYSSDRVLEAVSRILGANPLCSMATRSDAGALDIAWRMELSA